MGAKVRRFTLKIKGVSSDGKVELSAGVAPGESAGPVFNRKGQLLGFLAGKTDAMKDPPPDLLYGAWQIAPLLKHTGGSSFHRPARPKRTVTTRPAPGKTFLVYTVAVERFESK